MSQKSKARDTKRKNHEKAKRQEYERMKQVGKTWVVR